MKYFFLALISISALCSYVTNGATCNLASLDACDTCTATSGCGWCSPTQSCLEGTADGPLNSTCIGPAWNFGSCTPCPNYLTCETCLDHAADCVFCAALNSGLGGCRATGFVGCPGGVNRNGCPCNHYGICNTCVNEGVNCQWCGNTGECVTGNSTCGGTPVFNQTTQCTCNANNNCQSCQANGCDWCESGACSQAGTCPGPVALNCNGYCGAVASTCSGCVGLPGCGWCADTKKCVDTISNPCPVAQTCPVCSAATYCDLCKSITGCVWCDDSRTCEPNTNNTCIKTLSCSTYCEEQNNCGACNTVRGCTWCQNKDSCEDLATVTDCSANPGCVVPPSPVVSPGHEFDGGAFVGGMFLVVGIVILAVGGYMFYRWKTGKKVEYRQF